MTTNPPRDAGFDEQSTFARWQGVSGCPPPELLGPATEGTLQPAMLAARVRAHVEQCSLCATLLDVAAGVDPTSDETKRIEARVLAPVRLSARRRIFAAAAAVIVAVGGASIAWRTQSHEPQPAPETRTTGATSGPVYRLPLDKPVTELPPEALTLRSGSADPYAAALDEALAPYNRDDYQAAIAALAPLAARYPDKPHPAYYLGLSRLLAGDAAGAVDDLQKARRLASPGSSLSWQAAWYLAIALERSGRPASAIEPLQAVCAGGSARKAQACDGLRRLGADRR